ncbi:hypothetical protein QJS04_geneDACA014204 [Acorus gramineus]|uniref:Uncharacterized protein n=1 Tax=Acorus gramineus TaxID=55184 RepID=A0AAV9B5R3_ACOGR|nr:hypothetical protein QJS04_geneDACA014204 [Acorus gramineus]
MLFGWTKIEKKKMGISPSKRVERTLETSPEFSAACAAVFDRCLDLSNHSSAGVRPYQIVDAADLLHASLTSAADGRAARLVRRWVPAPPGRDRIDSAFRRVRSGGGGPGDLDAEGFRAFATELFKGEVSAAAWRAVIVGVPAGAAVIAGGGVAARAAPGIVRTAVEVYAVVVASAVYVLSG